MRRNLIRAFWLIAAMFWSSALLHSEENYNKPKAEIVLSYDEWEYVKKTLETNSSVVVHSQNVVISITNNVSSTNYAHSSFPVVIHYQAVGGAHEKLEKKYERSLFIEPNGYRQQ